MEHDIKQQASKCVRASRLIVVTTSEREKNKPWRLISTAASYSSRGPATFSLLLFEDDTR
jgi:hypothetical protein